MDYRIVAAAAPAAPAAAAVVVVAVVAAGSSGTEWDFAIERGETMATRRALARLCPSTRTRQASSSSYVHAHESVRRFRARSITSIVAVVVAARTAPDVHSRRARVLTLKMRHDPDFNQRTGAQCCRCQCVGASYTFKSWMPVSRLARIARIRRDCGRAERN